MQKCNRTKLSLHMHLLSERLSYQDHSNYTTFIILPPNIGSKRAIMGAWFSIWMIIGTIITYQILTIKDQQQWLILIIFMCFWAYYAFRVGRGFFWLLWGKELLKIDDNAFWIKKSIKGFGKSIPYYHENIDKIRLSLPKEGSMQIVYEATEWVVGSGTVEIEYFGKIKSFGLKLNESEAKQLYQVVLKRLELKMKTIEKKRYS
jgi:hypothetical protein